MKNRKASDRMAECIIETVHEYKQIIEDLRAKIEYLRTRIERLEYDVDYWKSNTNKAVEQCDKATDTLGEVAEIIAGITEHTEDGDIKIYLSNVYPENAVKLERLFKLLDIPMTADQIKEGDTIDKD